jgi:site-specific DNA-methyltransferase (adenine-specific)
MRQIVRAALPLGEGVVLDPFMGSGSTIAAAVALGYDSIGIELDPEFFKVATEAIPKLAAFSIGRSPLRRVRMSTPASVETEGELFVS